MVDLSIGTPVDPVPRWSGTRSPAPPTRPGYPTDRRHAASCAQAIAGWLAPALRRRPARPATAVLPTIGSKELVAWLPTLLGLGPGDTVVIPAVAYPTYEVGARLAGAPVRRGRLA